ncbi:hypothetical protein GCM10022245_05030 [Streptomyces mayteni]
MLVRVVGDSTAEVALGVEVELAGEQFDARVVADGDEEAGDRKREGLAGAGAAQGQPGELAVGALDLGDLAVPDELDLGVGEGALLHGLGGAQSVPAVHDGDRRAKRLRKTASSMAVSPPPITAMSCSRKKKPSHVAQ